MKKEHLEDRYIVDLFPNQQGNDCDLCQDTEGTYELDVTRISDPPVEKGCSICNVISKIGFKRVHLYLKIMENRHNLPAYGKSCVFICFDCVKERVENYSGLFKNQIREVYRNAFCKMKIINS